MDDFVGRRLVARCAKCGEWSTAREVFCPACRAPLVTMVPPSRRPLAVAAFVFGLVIIVAAILFRVGAFA